MSLLFISVVREGLARKLALADMGAASPALAGKALADALGLKASATLGTTPGAEVPLQLLGPQDVAGLDSRLVLRTDPPAGAQRVDTSLFAQVEFDPPGLPWWFTPLAPSEGRLRPWVALVVLPRDSEGGPFDIEPLRHGRLPVLTVERLEDLPPIEDTWAWAHSQVATADTGVSVPADLDRLVAERPEASLSRLLCPRRLEAGKHYVACVVPTFEATRTAGLGGDPATTVDPAWGPDAHFPLRLPVFYHWEFFTGEAANFEQSVRALRGMDPPARTGRVVDASKPGLASVADAAAAALPLAGALRPDSLTVAQYAGPAVAGYSALARTGHVVTSPAGRQFPVVDVPLYAGRHVAADQVGTAPAWVRELNTDPRHRAAAALGARIVRDNQEALMRSAWEQAGDVEAANRRLRQARLGRAASKRIVARHLAPLPDVDRLRALAPAAGRLGLPGRDRTLAGLLTASRLPDLVLDPAYTVLTRPGGRIGRLIAPNAGREVVTGIDAGTLQPDRGEVGRPGGLVTIDGLLGLVDAARASVRRGGGPTPVAINRIQPTEPGARVTSAAAGGGGRATSIRVTDSAGMLGGAPQRTVTLRGDFSLPSASTMRRIAPEHLTPSRIQALRGRLTTTIGGREVDVTTAHKDSLAELFAVVEVKPPAPPAPLDVKTVAGEALAAVEPEAAIARVALARLTLPAGATGDDPLGDVLASPQFPAPLAPELIRLAPDMVLPGLEEVPTDRVFAVVSNNAFVQAVLAGANHEVMRELRWRRYPTDERGTAFHRFWREDADEIPALHTIATGRLGAAVAGNEGHVVVVVRSDLLARFPGTQVLAVPSQTQGSSTVPDYSKPELPVFRGRLAPDAWYFGFAFTATTARRSPGRYVVFQQPFVAPAFGLDVSSTVPTFPAKASELAWTNVPLTGDFVAAKKVGAGTAFTDNSAVWGATAGDQAAATFQQPVRAAVHFRELLGAP